MQIFEKLTSPWKNLTSLQNMSTLLLLTCLIVLLVSFKNVLQNFTQTFSFPLHNPSASSPNKNLAVWIIGLINSSKTSRTIYRSYARNTEHFCGLDETAEEDFLQKFHVDHQSLKPSDGFVIIRLGRGFAWMTLVQHFWQRLHSGYFNTWTPVSFLDCLNLLSILV